MLSMLLAMLETEEDRERFLKLHGTYEKKLYAVAVRVLGDRTAAEDAVQQTWLQLIRRWDRVSGLAWSETEGYLVTAVKNAAVDMLRKERWEEALPEDWDPPAPETGETDYRYLVSLIRALPESYRRVLELKCVEEESNREIARRLGLKECDRLAAIPEELNKLGGQLTEGADFLEIRGVERLLGGVADSHNDHRIAMMLAVAATRAEGTVTIRGAESVAKSYPDFWEVYESLGGRVLRQREEREACDM